MRWWCMVGTPFMAFYIAGAILSTNLIILIKIFLLVCLYVVIHYVGQILYDDRLMALLPLSIYLSTKMWFYFTWIIYFMPFTSTLTTLVFLGSSTLLWYCFLKSWLGDAGVVSTSQQLQFRVSFFFVFQMYKIVSGKLDQMWDISSYVSEMGYLCFLFMKADTKLCN